MFCHIFIIKLKLNVVHLPFKCFKNLNLLHTDLNLKPSPAASVSRHILTARPPSYLTPTTTLSTTTCQSSTWMMTPSK